MNTSDIFDLFQLGETVPSSSSSSTAKGPQGSGLKGVLENLPELWDEGQYQEEYDMQSFMKSLETVKKWNYFRFNCLINN